MRKFIDDYNYEVYRFRKHRERERERNEKNPVSVDDFVDYAKLKWDGTLKQWLVRGHEAEFSADRARGALYRPFASKSLYFDRGLLNSVYLFPRFFPTVESERENRVIALTDVGSEKPFLCLMADRIVDLHIVGAGSSSQCFPFYTYADDGTARRENVSDWSLAHFRARYGPLPLPPDPGPPTAAEVARLAAPVIMSPGAGGRSGPDPHPAAAPPPSPGGGGSDSYPLPPGEGGRRPGEGPDRPTVRPALDTELRDFARKLRQEHTDAEQLIWRLLRDRRLNGRKFRRQHAVGPYVLDFYCHEAKLAVELDGGQHNEEGERRRDERRSEFLASKGIKTLRYWNHEALADTESVLEAIVLAIGEDPHPAAAPPPSPGGGGSDSYPLPPGEGGRRPGEGPLRAAEWPGEPPVRPIEKWDIFHYVYAVLHHPVYRAQFAEALKKELPRVPLVPEFARYVAVGRALAGLHVHYDHVPPHPLAFRWKGDRPIDWRVTKMKRSKDRTELVVNDALTLAAIPLQVDDYRLGNRSALDWVVEQYQVDAATGEDPNRPDDPEWIVRHVQRVVTVSLRTSALVASLPPWPDEAPATPAPAD